MQKSKNYYIGFTHEINGIGIMLDTNPPYSWIKKEWVFEVRLLWFKFWYVKEKKPTHWRKKEDKK